MTNGEKLKEVFPNMRIDVFESYVQVVGENYEFNNLYPLKWWNAECKESTTKNDLGVECISRDSAIKALDYDIESFEFKSGVSKHMDDIAKLLNTIYEIQVNNIKALPSVTPQEPRWISCSEKKPDEGGEYLLWGKIDESEEEDYCFIGDYHEFDEVFGVEISNYDPKTLGFIDTEIEEYYSVVAWMPLPKPYEPQESEGKE